MLINAQRMSLIKKRKKQKYKKKDNYNNINPQTSIILGKICSHNRKQKIRLLHLTGLLIAGYYAFGIFNIIYGNFSTNFYLQAYKGGLALMFRVFEV